MLVQILVVLLMLWILVARWQKRGMYKLWSQLPNNYIALPFIGHSYLFLGDDEDISDPAIAELVVKVCLEKDDIMKCSRLLIGNGSVFAPVPIWRPRRKFLAPTFSPKNLLQFVEIFSRQSAVMAEQLRARAGRGTFSIWKYITTYSMDSVCESTLGVNVNTQLQNTHPFLKAFEAVLKIDSARICQPWLHNDTVFKMMPIYKAHTEHRTLLCGFVDQIIKSKRRDIQEEKDVRKSKAASEQCLGNSRTFLELLIESTGGDLGFSDLELQEETLVLVLAGTDTTAVGTAFTALMLARHPDVQEKVYQEIKEIFGDTDRPVTVEDLPRLKYLDAVIRETLRLYPSVPIIVRKVTKDLTLPSGMTLVKDCGIVVNIWAIQRNPKYWGEDAMEFRPERFIDTPLKHPVAFMAFSHGPRGCIGYQYAMMSMKTAISTLVRQYRLRTSEDPKALKVPLRVKFDVMMKHVDNFQLQLEERH